MVLDAAASDPHRIGHLVQTSCIARYLRMLDTADRQEDEVAEMRISRLSERLEARRRQMRELQTMLVACEAAGVRPIVPKPLTIPLPSAVWVCN